MTAVGQVKRAVAAAIKAAGCAAIESYSEEQLKRYATAVAAVGTKETVIEESGAAQYLGEKVDEATQETVSVYGRKMLLTLLIEVYAPRTLGAAGCEEAAKTIGAAAVATKGTANKVELITSYEEGKSVFGEDASGVYGMSTLLKFLFANGAGAVKAVAVGKDESEEKDYASAFAALSDEEDVGVMVCDSAAQSVHLLLKTAAEDASAARRERIAVIGGSEETVAQMVNRAKAVNSERVVLVGPDIASDDGGTMSAVFAAAAVAAVIAGNTDPSVPINGAELTLFGAAGKRLSDNEIDQLVRGGVTPIETVGGVSSPVRGITTKTSSGGAADTTWRELTTILIVDEVIPTIRSALRTRFARSKNTAQSRGAIRSQVVLELEEMKSREIVDSYGEVLVSALKSDPTVCLVEFSFTVAHGLNRIYLTAHITV